MKKSLQQTSPSRKSRIALIKKPSQQQNDLTKFIQQNSLSVSNSNCDGPSPDYLQTLLNVNDELLAQGLASDSSSKETGSPHDLRSTSNRSFVSRLPTSPPLTDQEPFSPEQNQFISTPPFTPEERQD
jgi:hypothetical protein